ncbi:MAG: peptidoglycan DD-metalloendopeptidase family protein, partial [Pseudomonadota bacterium]
MLMADAAPQLKAKADALRASLERLNETKQRLDAERDQKEQTNREVGARRTLLADLLKTKQEERSVAAKLAQAAQSETAALAARAETLRQVLRALDDFAREILPRLKPERSASRPVARPAPRLAPRRKSTPTLNFPKAKGRLKAPIVGEISAKFGDPSPEGGKLEGLQFSSAPNAIVTAPHAADVKFAQFYPVTGNLIVLDVGDNYHILLMGVGSFLVDEGQTVGAGEPIAVMGAGPSTLNMEIRLAREPVNPLLWLERQTEG